MVMCVSTTLLVSPQTCILESDGLPMTFDCKAYRRAGNISGNRTTWLIAVAEMLDLISAVGQGIATRRLIIMC